MKYLLTMMVALVIASSTMAQENAPIMELVSPGPFIKFTEKAFDFGEIVQGDRVEHIFTFTNSGNAPILISNVQTTCGCTASSWSREPIAPGASSAITVNFNSSGKIGHQNKVVTIMSNATNNPETIKIVTNILAPTPEEG